LLIKEPYFILWFYSGHLAQVMMFISIKKKRGGMNVAFFDEEAI
jgi:hypothetical protein